MSKIYVSIFHSTVVTRTQCNTYFWTLLFLKLVGRKFRQKLRNCHSNAMRMICKCHILLLY